MSNSQQAKDETFPPGTVVLTDEEQKECQQMLRNLFEEEDGSWVASKDHAERIQRSIIAQCLMDRAKRFLSSAGDRLEPELAEKACTSAAKSCAIFQLSIHFYDFGCILMCVGKPEEARTMFSAFLRRVEADTKDPIKQILLRQRDIEAAKHLARQSS